ncbi:hypothetical protein OC861_004675 [Tilletia horrida]|nr:hypothetical protein OC861_004675 [Tilletia horrida]
MPKAEKSSRSSAQYAPSKKSKAQVKAAAPAQQPRLSSKGKERELPASATATALHVADFTLLPIRYLGKSNPVIHYLFVRAHHASTTIAQASSDSGSTSSLPQDRTLFVANLPPDTTDRYLRTLFKNAGAIERIALREVSSVPFSSSPPYCAQDDKEAPAIQLLPPLDPRELQGQTVGANRGDCAFLTTSAHAHIIFLDESSLRRALTQTQQTSAEFMQLGGPALIEKEQTSAGPALAALLKLARPWPGEEVLSRSSTKILQQQKALADGTPAPLVGLPFLLASHSSHRPSLDRVKAFADSRIALHIYLRANPERDLQHQEKLSRRGIKAVQLGPDGELLDEDGFTIVTSGGKYGRSAESGSKDARSGEGASVRVARNKPHMASGDAYAQAAGAPKKKSKSKDLEDFYRFQTREKNREKLATLRAKFEEDKAKVAKLKQSRAFKPY